MLLKEACFPASEGIFRICKGFPLRGGDCLSVGFWRAGIERRPVAAIDEVDKGRFLVLGSHRKEAYRLKGMASKGLFVLIHN